MAGKRKFVPDRDQLEKMYQSNTMAQLAAFYGVGETVVWRRIHEYGIKLKGNEDNPRKRPKQPFSPEHLQALRTVGMSRRGRWAGENNPNWQGGRHDVHMALRRTGAYMQWKAGALELAGHKCQQCGAEKGRICECCGHKTQLHVHHVKSFAKHPKDRFDPANSEVLCERCHRSRHFGKIR